MSDRKGMRGNPAAANLTHYDVRDAADGAIVQAEATLALAWEQRTANMLAYLEYSTGDDYELVHDIVRERLGLSDD